jgi:hypothetical protein
MDFLTVYLLALAFLVIGCSVWAFELIGNWWQRRREAQVWRDIVERWDE